MSGTNGHGRRRPHGRAPQMSAALRRAVDDFQKDRARQDGAVGDWLVSCGIEPRDAETLLDVLYDHFNGPDVMDYRHPFGEAMNAVRQAGERGEDEDAEPLLDTLIALPAGQRATLLAMFDMALAIAAAEGVAIGALYLAHDLKGRDERGRSRPRR